MGLETNRSSESSVSLCRDSTSSSAAASPGTRLLSSRCELRVSASSRSSGIGHSRVTLGSTTVKRKSIRNWSTT